MKKNVANQLISAQMVSVTDGSDVTAGTCNVAVEVDGVAGTGGTATHIANGKWEFAPIQADTNGDYLTFQFTISGAITTTVQVYTHFPQSVDNETRLAAIEADTNELQTDDIPGLIATAQADLDIITAADGVNVSATDITAIADAFLNRDMSAVSDTNARSPLNALRLLRNKYSVSGSTLTVTKEDDSTSAWTATLTTDAAADPVTGSDPA